MLKTLNHTAWNIIRMTVFFGQFLYQVGHGNQTEDLSDATPNA